MLAAGSLRHRIEILTIESAQDSDGNVQEVELLFADAWADVRHVSGREFIAAGAEQREIVATVLIRKIDGIKRWMRIRHGERMYNILAVLNDPVSGNEYLTLPCSEVSGE